MYVFFGPFLPLRLTGFLEICISRFCAVLRQLLLCPEILLFVHGLPSNSNFLLCVAVLTGKNIAERRDDAIKSHINSFMHYGCIFIVPFEKFIFLALSISISQADALFAWLEMHLYYPAFCLFIEKT